VTHKCDRQRRTGGRLAHSICRTSLRYAAKNDIDEWQRAVIRAIDTRCCWYCSCCWKRTTYMRQTWSSLEARQLMLMRQLSRAPPHHDNRRCPRRRALHGRSPVATVLLLHAADSQYPTTTSFTRRCSTVTVVTASATDSDTTLRTGFKTDWRKGYG